MRDDFPAPTVPTTATRLPCLHLMLIDFKIGLSSGPHEKVPFSMTIGSADNKNLNSMKLQRRKFTAIEKYFLKASFAKKNWSQVKLS
jgi:hypothetical protein